MTPACSNIIKALSISIRVYSLKNDMIEPFPQRRKFNPEIPNSLPPPNSQIIILDLAQLLSLPQPSFVRSPLGTDVLTRLRGALCLQTLDQTTPLQGSYPARFAATAAWPFCWPTSRYPVARHDWRNHSSQSREAEGLAGYRNCSGSISAVSNRGPLNSLWKGSKSHEVPREVNSITGDLPECFIEGTRAPVVHRADHML
jgi:hypothetical protein